ncbi:hypothetical protein UA45_21755 [Morganella morganii]|uniref:Uncharacterized protein n=1 Tax=Morganella morganii TaxID=582 RepID=A0A0D8L4M3_MORMO|nr:hypothetical protein UA45_21755 [Morganella morganii]
MADIRYITGGADGWLNVKREPAQNIIALPGTLKVDVTSNKNGRDYFTASEGVEKGKTSLLKRGIYHGSARITDQPHHSVFLFQMKYWNILTGKYMPSPMISTQSPLVFTIFKYLISRMMAVWDIPYNHRLPKIGFIWEQEMQSRVIMTGIYIPEEVL